MQSEILVFMKSLHCTQCGKTPSHSCFIRPKESGGPDLYFNLFPLCTKHMHEHLQLGTKVLAAKYRNVQRLLEHKGWYFDGNWCHRDLKES